MFTVGLPAAIVFICFYPYRKRALTAMGLYSGPLREVFLVLFVALLFGVLGVALWPVYRFDLDVLELFVAPVFASVNLIPFRMFSDYLHEWSLGNGSFVLLNFVGNVSVFIPIGLFPALLWDGHSWRRTVAIGFGMSLLIESCQYFLGRSSDIDDLILNTLGAFCGYWLFLLLRRFAPSFSSKFRCKKQEVPYGR